MATILTERVSYYDSPEWAQRIERASLGLAQRPKAEWVRDVVRRAIEEIERAETMRGNPLPALRPLPEKRKKAAVWE